jgi:outer membrane protein assembly factor BamE (lipoprotein component of BamABCDE complex)
VRALALVVAIITIPAAGCVKAGGGISQTSVHGYVVPELAVEQVPPGSSKDQVIIALGSPSTTGHYGNEVFYYISQKRKQTVGFLPSHVVGQSVLAVYFDKNEKVERIANYGLKDGKVFDFISATTPTGGRDESFLQQVLGGVVGIGANPFGN